jgi:hypothetical protein
MQTQTIEATISVVISHRAGPEITDPAHVIRWICADGQAIGGTLNGFRFEVCPKHADPDECSCTGEVAIYAAEIMSADFDGESAS